MNRPRKLTVAFDVDGTLIDDEDRPRKDIIQILVKHAIAGDIVYVWSGGGVSYASTWVGRLGIERWVDRVIAKQMYTVKPDVAYDDQIVKLGKKNVCVGSGDHEERW